MVFQVEIIVERGQKLSGRPSCKKTKRRLFGRRDSREIRGLSSSSIAGSLSHHCTLALVIDVVRSLGISCRRFLWFDLISFSGWIFPIAQLTFFSPENRGEPP
ncbi:hypothetical protein BDV39DRAFT_187877 [Aspergillus sergii]|uniref:Uncharacterized protein n=1 Tax=Aspergillus sergii TaxID=1034303 RepID=A0A5N6WHV8_9EURO|nr:hypothetical protein BDV39DRAFT_187877 [Aspergillus sergii]